MLATIIARNIPLAKDEAGQLYYWKGGCYNPGAEFLVHEAYIRLLSQWGREVEWKGSVSDETVKYIRYSPDIPMLWARPPIDRINFLNGIFDIEQSILEDHDSDRWLSTVQIPIRYDPKVKSQYWPQFCHEVFPEGVDLIYQLLAWLLVPYTRLQKTVLLLGEGSNGKGTFLRGLDALFGSRNISHVSLHQLEEEKFSRPMIVGKLVNVFGDLPIHEIDNLSFFKALTGEDTINIEYKGLQPFPYKPFCRLIFSSNTIPKTNDNTKGYLRRWLIIPFTRVFSVNPKMGQELENNLADPTELSGLLNIILPKIAEVIETGFSISEEITDIVSNYAPLPDNVEKWARDWLVESETSFIPSHLLYQAYVRTLRGTPGEEGFNKGKLAGYIKQMFGNVEINKSHWVDGKNQKCYKGIAWKKEPSIPLLVEHIS